MLLVAIFFLLAIGLGLLRPSFLSFLPDNAICRISGGGGNRTRVTSHPEPPRLQALRVSCLSPALSRGLCNTPGTSSPLRTTAVRVSRPAAAYPHHREVPDPVFRDNRCRDNRGRPRRGSSCGPGATDLAAPDRSSSSVQGEGVRERTLPCPHHRCRGSVVGSDDQLPRWAQHHRLLRSRSGRPGHEDREVHVHGWSPSCWGSGRARLVDGARAGARLDEELLDRPLRVRVRGVAVPPLARVVLR